MVNMYDKVKQDQNKSVNDNIISSEGVDIEENRTILSIRWDKDFNIIEEFEDEV